MLAKPINLRICAYLAAAVLMAGIAVPASAETTAEARRIALENIARQFAARIPPKILAADQAMGISTENNVPLPDGETLLFNVALPKNLVLDNIITAEVHNRTLLYSLRDTVACLEFPIHFDGSRATGWYIRDTKKFKLDSQARTVSTQEGAFSFSGDVIAKDGDVWVPSNEIAQWFGLTIKPNVAELKLDLSSSTPLPAQERYNRRNRSFAQRHSQKPELPFHLEPEKAIDFPVIDVSNTAAYDRPAQGKKLMQRNATIATSGDFAYGTLITQTNLDDDDIVSNLRATYKKETLAPELLGPLHARKYELGSINIASLPLTSAQPAGLGFHVTNADPLRGTLDASTDISGYALPGWDVELYRDNQILGTQTVGEDGRYNFTQVDLFSAENNFRVVLYGPQGETREENISVPVDNNRLTRNGSAYDISLTSDHTKIYDAAENSDEDYASPRLNARLEQSFGAQSRLSLGLEAGQNDGESQAITHAGVSTTAAGTLLNLNTAFDQKGEAAGEFIARRSFGDHLFRNTTQAATKNFGRTGDDDGLLTTDTGHDIFGNELSLNGPLPVGIGSHPRYNLFLDYGIDANNDAATQGIVGFNTGFGRLSFNQQIRYMSAEQDRISSLTAINGSIGRNRLRLTSEYEIKPEQQIDNLRASLQRSIGDSINIDVGLDRYFQDRLTEASAQVNWQAGHVLISPSIAYNSDGDMRAMLSSRFGAARDPQTGKIHTFDRAISLNGGLSAFVFLDANGNGVHDKGEEPVKDAVIAAPQNGGRAQTGEDGYAYISRLEKLRLTDVYLEKDSLQDPYWVPATKGVSILPREGHITQLNFPILLAGEVEGTLCARDETGALNPVRGMAMAVYNQKGEKIADTVTDSTGYYLISPIPPGDYWLVTGGDNFRSDSFERPAPSSLKIGFDGTSIHGHDIVMKAGNDDAPMRILASLDDLKADQPGLDINALQNRKVILNLGTYHSRILMGLMWYKARSFAGDALAGLQTLIDPTQSYAAKKTGLHTLRIGADELTLQDGIKRCGMLNAAGIECTLEILPGTLQMAGL